MLDPPAESATTPSLAHFAVTPAPLFPLSQLGKGKGPDQKEMGQRRGTTMKRFILSAAAAAFLAAPLWADSKGGKSGGSAGGARGGSSGSMSRGNNGGFVPRTGGMNSQSFKPGSSASNHQNFSSNTNFARTSSSDHGSRPNASFRNTTPQKFHGTPGSKEYFKTHGVNFKFGCYYPGRHHCHWSHFCWSSKYNCNCYWCPSSSCYYYWYEPGCCYYPLSYISYAQPTTLFCEPSAAVSATGCSIDACSAISTYTVPVQVQVASKVTQGPILASSGPVDGLPVPPSAP